MELPYTDLIPSVSLLQLLVHLCPLFILNTTWTPFTFFSIALYHPLVNITLRVPLTFVL